MPSERSTRRCGPRCSPLFSVLGARSYAAHELVACAVGGGDDRLRGLLGRRVGGERPG